MKRGIAVLLTCLLLVASLGFSGAVFAQDEISVTINGQAQSYDQMPVMESDRVLVPMRGIFEALGAEITWEESTETVTGKLGGTTVVLSIGNTNATVNGATVTLDVPARLINDRTMVPVRFISESLGANVDWDDATQTVIITTAGQSVLKEMTFDDMAELKPDVDFIPGAEYTADRASLSSEQDHTTGSGKSVKMGSRAKADDRLKFKNMLSSADMGKTYVVSAWVYTDAAGVVLLGLYGDKGTDYAFRPVVSANLTVEPGQWTQIQVEYQHDIADITQVGICQPSGESLIPTIYIDDVTIAEGKLPEGSGTPQQETPDEVQVVNGHRPVPTSNISDSSSMDDLVFYTNVEDEAEKLANLPEGKIILSNDDMLAASRQKVEDNGGKVEEVSVTGVESSKGLRVTIPTLPVNPYATQLEMSINEKFETGDLLMMKISMRTISGGLNETNEGQIQCVIEEDGGAYYKIIQGNVMAGPDWVTGYFPFTATPEYLDNVHATIRLGYYVQVVEITDFEVINYGKSVSIEDLPKTLTYKGAEKDAKWRQDAIARIEQIRKGDINVIVKDAAGNVVPNADVKVDMYEHEFQWGTAVNGNLFGSDTAKTTKYRNAIKTYFNGAVLESEHKWVTYENDPESARKMVDWLLENGISQVRGHTLVWDRDYYSKPWEDNTTVPQDLVGLIDDKAALDKRISDHIARIAGEFKGQLVDWDVINELVKNHGIRDKYGNEVIKQWFDWARAADPDAQLYINETGINGAQSESFDEFCKVLDWMVANDVDFDGIGIQTHMSSLNDPETFYNQMCELAKYGKRLKVTEFDLNVQDEDIQADYTRDIMIAIFSQENFDGFVMWGFWDGSHWLKNAPLFKNDWTLKKSGEMYIDLVYNKWWTKEAGKTGADGQYSVRGYYGDYDITVTANGQTKTVQAKCYKGQDNTITVTLD